MKQVRRGGCVSRYYKESQRLCKRALTQRSNLHRLGIQSVGVFRKAYSAPSRFCHAGRDGFEPPPAWPFRKAPILCRAFSFEWLIRFVGMIGENIAMLRTRLKRPAVLRERRVIEQFLLPRRQTGRHRCVSCLCVCDARRPALSVAEPQHMKSMPARTSNRSHTFTGRSPESVIERLKRYTTELRHYVVIIRHRRCLTLLCNQANLLRCAKCRWWPALYGTAVPAEPLGPVKPASDEVQNNVNLSAVLIMCKSVERIVINSADR